MQQRLKKFLQAILNLDFYAQIVNQIWGKCKAAYVCVCEI